MKLLLIRAVASLFGIAVFVSAAMAARLPTSTLLVHVISVEEVSFARTPGMMKFGHPVGDMRYETTTYIATVQILNVINTDHGLTQGQTIGITYEIVQATPPRTPPRGTPLKPGEDVTLEVMGRDGMGNYARR